MIKKRTRTNWHEAITCAIQIDLRDYAHLLEYYTEYTLSANGNHIDMLVIKKQIEFQIPKVIDNLTKDLTSNKNNQLYTNYMNQFFYSHMKGDQFMVCEGLLNYFGTSSEELLEQGAQKAQEIYLPQIDKLTSENTLLHSEIAKYKKLLAENNISY